MWMRQQASAEKRWRSRIQKALDQQTKDFILYADQNGIGSALTMLDYVVTSDGVATVIQQLYLQEGARAGITQQRELNRAFGSEYKAFSFFTDWVKTMTNFFYSYGMKAITQITETTRDRIRRVTSEQIARQASYPEMRDAITGDGINAKRANVIARTETVTAMGNAKRVAALSLPFKMIKEWIAIHDKRTRHSHRNIDGETRPLEQAYSNGGMNPGDPELPAKERIQCRCTEVYTPMRDSAGRPIRK